jgi:hypothetical protein
MRQVEGLIQEGIQQSIRSLLPVKTLLREYLNDDGEDDDDKEETNQKKKDDDEDEEEEEEDKEEKPLKKKEEVAEPETVVEAPQEEAESKAQEVVLEQPKEQPKEEQPPTVQEVPVESPPVLQISASSLKNGVVTITKEESAPPPTPVPTPVSFEQPVQQQQQPQVPTLVVETEPSVSFTNMDTIFDSDNPERNEIMQTFPDDVETIETLNLPPEEMDGFEELA